MRACRANSLPSVAVLLALRAPAAGRPTAGRLAAAPTAHSAAGESALTIACAGGFDALVAALLAAGVPPDAVVPKSQNTALHAAAAAGRQTCTALVADAYAAARRRALVGGPGAPRRTPLAAIQRTGMCVGWRDHAGRSAADAAAAAGHAEVAEWLAQRQAREEPARAPVPVGDVEVEDGDDGGECEDGLYPGGGWVV